MVAVVDETRYAELSRASAAEQEDHLAAPDRIEGISQKHVDEPDQNLDNHHAHEGPDATHRAVAIAVQLALCLTVAAPPDVSAHCPGTAPPFRNYAGGTHDFAGMASGVRASIQFTNPAVCANGLGNAFTLEGVSLCPNDSCASWVQVGWVKRQGIDSSPVAYCEYRNAGAAAVQFHFAMSAATHEFRWERSANSWDCRIDGALKVVTTAPSFVAGGFANAQGENNSNHTQIGRMAPAKLAFNSAQYRLGVVWNNMQLTLNQPNAPYGVDSLGAGSMRNWTNAH